MIETELVIRYELDEGHTSALSCLFVSENSYPRLLIKIRTLKISYKKKEKTIDNKLLIYRRDDELIHTLLIVHRLQTTWQHRYSCMCMAA